VEITLGKRDGIIYEALKMNRTLTTLYVNETEMHWEGMSAYYLAEALKVNMTLTKVDASLNSLGDRGAVALAKMLPINKTLRKLNLTGIFDSDSGEVSWTNDVGEEGIVALLDGLEMNTTLLRLKLDGNNLMVKYQVGVEKGVNPLINDLWKQKWTRYKRRLYCLLHRNKARCENDLRSRFVVALLDVHFSWK
jgi:hypothetical protein